MNDKTDVVVKTFSNEMDAKLAQLNLESMGIEAQIHKDDCGGAYPQLQVTGGVQLVVGINDVERAKTILDEIEADEVSDIKGLALSRKPLKWRLFFIGVFVGVCLVGIASMILNKDSSILDGKFEFDNNADGKPDEFHHYENGSLINIHEDRNYNGTLDSWFYYESNRIARSESDDNFDGKIDGWATYVDRNNFEARYDTDFDGVPDGTEYFAKGLKQRVDWNSPDSGIIVRREIFKDGIKSEEYIDTNNDGNFDIKLRFNQFEQEVSRTSYKE